jgi:GH15 family glucan-1,4-alpha-glucosidase
MGESPDYGIGEIRGQPQHFTHSKMMAWVAFDRGVKLVEEFGCSGEPHVERWRELRDSIHRQVCELGYKPKEARLYAVLWLG